MTALHASGYGSTGTQHVGHFSVITSRIAERSIWKLSTFVITSSMIDVYRALSLGSIRRKTSRGLNLLRQFSAGQVIAQWVSRIRNTEGNTFSAKYCDNRVVWGCVRYRKNWKKRFSRGRLTELRSLSQTKCPDGHVIPSLEEWHSRQMMQSDSWHVVDNSDTSFIRIFD